jgi:hypothetical protein
MEVPADWQIKILPRTVWCRALAVAVGARLCEIVVEATQTAQGAALLVSAKTEEFFLKNGAKYG